MLLTSEPSLQPATMSFYSKIKYFSGLGSISHKVSAVGRIGALHQALTCNDSGLEDVASSTMKRSPLLGVLDSFSLGSDCAVLMGRRENDVISLVPFCGSHMVSLSQYCFC